jgi:uncharacterized radical SAM superfamily protein
MNWNKNDILYLSMINEYGQKYIDKQMKAASQQFLKMKNKPEYTIFGSYHSVTKSFVWINSMNTVAYDMIKNNYMDVFRNEHTLKKLFKIHVSLPTQFYKVIPYLMKVINAAFHVISFPLKDKIMFALVKLDLPDTVDFDVFDDIMLTYHTHLMKQSKTKVHKKHKKRHTHKKRV